MSNIYPDAEILDLNSKESIKSWNKSGSGDFVKITDDLYSKLENWKTVLG